MIWGDGPSLGMAPLIFCTWLSSQFLVLDIDSLIQVLHGEVQKIPA